MGPCEIRPPLPHNHVHTVHYSPRRLAPLRPRRPMADPARETVEPWTRTRQLWHRAVPCNLGMRIPLCPNERRKLNGLLCPYVRFQSSASQLSFSSVVWSCCGGRCRYRRRDGRLRAETLFHPAQMPTPVKSTSSPQQNSRVARAPRPRRPEDRGDLVGPPARSRPDLFLRI